MPPKKGKIKAHGLDDRQVNHMSQLMDKKVNKLRSEFLELSEKVSKLIGIIEPNQNQNKIKVSKKVTASDTFGKNIVELTGQPQPQARGAKRVQKNDDLIPDDTEKRVKLILDNFDDYSSNSSFSDEEMDHCSEILSYSLPAKVGGSFNALDTDVEPNIAVAQTSRNKVNKSGNHNKPPPIFIEKCGNAAAKDIRQWLLNNHKDALLRVTSCSNTEANITLFSTSIKQFNEIKETLKTKEYKFFTYTPRAFRPRIFLLRGIHHDIDPMDIKAELLEKGLKVSNVFPMNRRFTSEAGEVTQNKLPCYTVITEPDTKLSDVKLIVGCCGYRVKWEIKKKPEVSQCRRCQKYGHAAANCNLNYKCVKCTDNHQPGECPRGKDRSEPARCINCNGGHPANYINCPSRENYVSRLNQYNSNVNNIAISKSNREFNSSFRKPGFSYADSLRPKSKSINPESRFPQANRSSMEQDIDSPSEKSPLSELFNMSKELFGMDFNRLTESVASFLNRLKTIKDITSRRTMYLNFISQFLK